MGEAALRIDETVMKVALPVRVEIHQRDGKQVHIASCKPFGVEVCEDSREGAVESLRSAVVLHLRQYSR